MNVFQAIIQGIVQGATEFLPVSSSGHLSLIQHIMGVSLQSLLFDVILHAGTLVAVIAVYFKQILKLLKEFFLIIRDIFTGRFSVKNMNPYRRMVIMLIISLIPLFLLFLPVPGMADTKLKDLSDKWSTDTNIMVEGFSFLLTSILLFWGVSSNRKFNSKHYSASNHFNDRKTGVRNYMLLPDAVCIGIVQVFAALLPGLSRSGSTISTGLIRGIDKKTSVDYSFLLGIPSILAAAVLLMKDSQNELSTIDPAVLLAGFFSSLIVGLLAIIVLKWMVVNDKLYIFAYYTLILGIITIAVSIIEAVTGNNLFTGSVL